MDSKINAHCTICGTGYHVCSSCKEETTFMPWRTVVDSVEHYKIYTVLHGYTLKKDVKKTYEELSSCDISGLKSFLPEVQEVIKEILDKGKPVKVTKKRSVEPKAQDKDKTEIKFDE